LAVKKDEILVVKKAVGNPQGEDEALWRQALLEILDAKTTQIRNAFQRKKLTQEDVAELTKLIEETRHLIAITQ
jgi:hypothetical protein